MQLLGALSREPACAGSGSGQGMPQRCCALASVLAAKRCHCSLSAAKQAVARLSGVRQQCLQQSRSIVEMEFFVPDGSSLRRGGQLISNTALELLEDELLSEEEVSSC